jgi:hypothetical protein
MALLRLLPHAQQLQSTHCPRQHMVISQTCRGQCAARTACSRHAGAGCHALPAWANKCCAAAWGMHQECRQQVQSCISAPVVWHSEYEEKEVYVASMLHEEVAGGSTWCMDVTHRLCALVIACSDERNTALSSSSTLDMPQYCAIMRLHTHCNGQAPAHACVFNRI